MALFTIEQIELIRRLKSSGITKEQVLQAFNELDRLDAEFSRNMPYSDPLRNHNGLEFPYDNVSPEAPNNNSSGMTNGNISNLSTATVNGMPDSCLPVPYKQNEMFGSHSLSRTHCSSTNSSESIPESEIHNGDFASHSSELSSKLQSELNAISAADSTSNATATDSMSQSLFNNSVSCSFFPFESQPEELAELQELKKKGDMAVLAEIRNFVMTYNIKQTLIAEMTKMSQPYVSRFFRGDIQDMPDRTKNIFYMWYLTCKNNPLKLAQMCPNSGVKRMVSESGDLIPLKRERFTFKGSHLAVLERYYEQDPYPDTQVREMIVEECNKAAEKAEWPLSERDIVTLPVVNNWFNNRRKDAKKQMRLKHGSPPSVGVQSSCQASTLSSMHPATVWSPCVVSSPPSYHVYQDRNDITESDSSSASDRLMESENLVIDLQEQEPCDHDIGLIV